MSFSFYLTLLISRSLLFDADIPVVSLQPFFAVPAFPSLMPHPHLLTKSLDHICIMMLSPLELQWLSIQILIFKVLCILAHTLELVTCPPRQFTLQSHHLSCMPHLYILGLPLIVCYPLPHAFSLGCLSIHLLCYPPKFSSFKSFLKLCPTLKAHITLILLSLFALDNIFKSLGLISSSEKWE